MTTVVGLLVIVAEAHQRGLGGEEGFMMDEEEVRNQIVLSIRLQFKLGKRHLSNVSYRCRENLEKLFLPLAIVENEATEVEFTQTELRFLGEGGQLVGERLKYRISLHPFEWLEGELDRAVRRAERFALTLRLGNLLGFAIVVPIDCDESEGMIFVGVLLIEMAERLQESLHVVCCGFFGRHLGCARAPRDGVVGVIIVGG
jgi:hypothetical protein